MENKFLTNRLIIEPITENEDLFILELVNTDDWIKYIGNKNILSKEDALLYIRKIMTNSNLIYWIVKLKESDIAIGLITFIKRDYLEYNDIGFAFLPKYHKKGYAFEASFEILNQLIKKDIFYSILGITIPENISSIKLLEKLGFEFEKIIEVENEILKIYKI